MNILEKTYDRIIIIILKLYFFNIISFEYIFILQFFLNEQQTSTYLVISITLLMFINNYVSFLLFV